MKTALSYFELLCPEPIPVEGVGHAHSPTLREIARLGYGRYGQYLGLLATELDSFLQMTNLTAVYNNLPENEKASVSLYDLLLVNQKTRELLESLFSFFFAESATFDQAASAFVLRAGSSDEAAGTIDRDNFDKVRTMLLQLNYVQTTAPGTAKNARAQKILDKIQKAKERQTSVKHKDQDFSLGNMISSLAAQHNSLHILNIWDLTVYQLYDQFFRQNNKNQMDIHALNYAVWGGEFDPAGWFKALNI